MPTIKALLDQHVTLSVECLDRLCLNGYIPALQTGPGVVRFLVDHLKFPVVSPALLGRISKHLIAQAEASIEDHQTRTTCCELTPDGRHASLFLARLDLSGCFDQVWPQPGYETPPALTTYPG